MTNLIDELFGSLKKPSQMEKCIVALNAKKETAPCKFIKVGITEYCVIHTGLRVENK